VYWIPVYQILESRGLEVCLVNAQHVKNVPGRKTDVSDCQWLQYLHSVGLLRASFRPPGFIRVPAPDFEGHVPCAQACVFAGENRNGSSYSYAFDLVGPSCGLCEHRAAGPENRPCWER
jgi:hypothetical protein